MEVILKDWQEKWDLGEKSGERSREIGDRGGGGDFERLARKMGFG